MKGGIRKIGLTGLGFSFCGPSILSVSDASAVPQIPLSLIFILLAVGAVVPGVIIFQAPGIGSMMSFPAPLGEHLVWCLQLEWEPGPASMSRDGGVIALSLRGPPDRLVLLDADSGSKLWQFTVEGEPWEENATINSLALTPNAKYVAAGTVGGDIYLLEGKSGGPVGHWRLPAPIGWLEISERGTFLAAAFTNQILFMSRLSPDPLWNTSVTALPHTITSLSMDVRGSYMVAGTTDGYVAYLRAGDGHILWRYPALSPIRKAALTSDGSLTLAVCSNRCIAISQSGDVLQTYVGEVEAASLASTGRYLATAHEGTVHIHGLSKPDPLHTYNLTTQSSITTLVLSNEGYTLLAGDGDGKLHVADTWRSHPKWWTPLGEDILVILAPDAGFHFTVLTETQLLTLTIQSKTEGSYPIIVLSAITIPMVSAIIITLRKVRLSSDHHEDH